MARLARLGTVLCIKDRPTHNLQHKRSQHSTNNEIQVSANEKGKITEEKDNRHAKIECPADWMSSY